MKIKSSTMDKVFVTFNTIFLVLFVTITLYPVLNTVALSFNDGVDAVRGGIHLWPRIFTLSNYKTVLHQQNILTGAVVSVARTVLGTIFALVTNALLAYIISRKRFLFRSQLSLFWVITMYVNGGMIPTLILYRNMNLTNSFWVYVIPGMVSAFNVLVMRTFMEGLPSALEESAMIDGANDFTIFTRIISPLCKPVYATVALFVAVGQWNSWFDAMLYNRMNTQYTTLQYELMKLLSSVMQQSGSATTGGNTATAAVTPVTVRSAATVVIRLLAVAVRDVMFPSASSSLAPSPSAVTCSARICFSSFSSCTYTGSVMMFTISSKPVSLKLSLSRLQNEYRSCSSSI